jgi:hypothetical protein
MRLRPLFTVFVIAVLFPAPTLPQSLAEVARKEEARRKTLRGGGKVYTNDDLGPVREVTPAPAPGSPASAAATPPAAPEAKPPASTDAKDEKYWKNRMTAAQQSLSRSKVMLGALEARVNALNTDFVNTDDPIQRNVIQENLNTAMAELERVKKDIATGTSAITALEEEARKANVPPGWLR